MNNVTSSFLLLALAVFLLWLAATNKLSNLLDAWDVATGKTTAQKTATASAGSVSLTLPTLPAVSTTAQVGL